MSKQFNTKMNTNRSGSKYFRYLLIVLAVLAIGLLISEITNNTYIFHKASQPPNPNTNYPGQSIDNLNNSAAPKDSNNTGSVASNDTTKSPNSLGSTGNFSGNLIKPYGRFVSQHNPSNTSDLEQSACISSSGATCTITFSLNGKVISLPTKATDGSGTAYWNNWTPKQYGLTSGSWTITASARAGDQVKSTVDPNGKLIIP